MGEEVAQLGLLVRLIESDGMAAVLPRAYRSRRLRALIFALDPGSELRANLVREFLRWCYRMFNERGEIPMEVFTDDVQLYQAAELLGTTGTFHGQDGIKRALLELHEAFDEVRFAPEDVMTVGHDKVLVLIRFQGIGRGSGVPVDVQIAHVFEVTDGSASRWEVHWEREDAFRMLDLQQTIADS